MGDNKRGRGVSEFLSSRMKTGALGNILQSRFEQNGNA